MGSEKFEGMYLNAISTENLKRCFCRDVSKWSKPLPTSKRTGWKRRSLALGRLAGSVTKHCLMKSFCCSSSRDSMHFWMVSAVTWSKVYRKHSNGNKSKKRGCWLPGHPSRRYLSTQVQSFREHTYLGNKQWFQHFHNIRHLGVFFLNKFGLYVNLTKCKYVDGTSEGHARSLWEMNVI